MVDVVDSATRSRMMSGIRGRNTKPEILIRSLLHRHGFRFRLHVRDLPGKPDIVLPRYPTRQPFSRNQPLSMSMILLKM